MKIYDFKNISKLYVCGITSLERVFNTLTSKNQVILKSKSSKKKFTNPYDDSVVIVSGDTHIGFNELDYYLNIFEKYNNKLSESNTIVLFMRGNNDNPLYFTSTLIELSNIKTIPDYSVIMTESFNTLCIGGAISIDRTWRIKHEELVNKHNKSSRRKQIWWENEGYEFNKFELDGINSSEIKINSIISHTAPFVGSILKMKINDDYRLVGKEWFSVDSKLKYDINKERGNLSKLFHNLTANGSDIKFWCHSHFFGHPSQTFELNGNKKMAICSVTGGIYNAADIIPSDKSNGTFSDKMKIKFDTTRVFETFLDEIDEFYAARRN